MFNIGKLISRRKKESHLAQHGFCEAIQQVMPGLQGSGAKHTKMKRSEVDWQDEQARETWAVLAMQCFYRRVTARKLVKLLISCKRTIEALQSDPVYQQTQLEFGSIMRLLLEVAEEVDYQKTGFVVGSDGMKAGALRAITRLGLEAHVFAKQWVEFEVCTLFYVPVKDRALQMAEPRLNLYQFCAWFIDRFCSNKVVSVKMTLVDKSVDPNARDAWDAHGIVEFAHAANVL